MRSIIYRTLTIAGLLTFPVRWCIQEIVLISIYFLIVFPIGGTRKLFNATQIKMRVDKSPGTYWEPVEKRPRKSYYRNF